MIPCALTTEELLTGIIDKILLNLWYANYYEKQVSLSKKTREEQVAGFRNQADGLMQFLYQNVYQGTSLIPYEGIFVPENYIPWFENRKTKYKHPEES